MRLFERDGVWYISLRRGHKKSLKTKDKTLALQAFKRIQKQILLGKVVSIEQEKHVTLSQFKTDYMTTMGPLKADASRRSDELSLDTLIAHVTGSRYLHALVKKHLDDMISTLLKAGREKTTINTYLRRIKAAMNVAVEWKYIKANPFAKVKQLKVDKKKPRFLYGDEPKRLFEKITDPDFRNMVLFYIHTGCRRAELVRLTWGDVMEVEGKHLVVIRETKTCVERAVKANKELSRIIKAMQRGKDGDYIFPRWRTPDAVTRLFRKYADDAGIPHIRLHDLRHTTASHLVMAGVPLKTVAEVLGHSRTSTTDIYAHLVPEHLEDAMSELEQSFNVTELENKNVVAIDKGKKN